ncbi:hypothetical protein KEN19_CDS0374 [Pseudomonas phage vB_PaePAO1-KEN19]
MYINTKWFPCNRNITRQNSFNCWDISMRQSAAKLSRNGLNVQRLSKGTKVNRVE